MKTYVVYFKDFFVVREAKTSQEAMDMASKELRLKAVHATEDKGGVPCNKLTKFFVS